MSGKEPLLKNLPPEEELEEEFVRSASGPGGQSTEDSPGKGERPSREETEEAGWKLMAHTFDLHHDPSMSEGNVMTEYEEKFSSMGNPIYKLIAGR